MDPLIKEFSIKIAEEDKIPLIKRLNTSLSNDDVLQCVSMQTLQCLTQACLEMCALEKIKISLKTSGIKEIMQARNEVISEIQSCITKILNSHSFTMVLAMLISMLKEYIPIDLSVELAKEQIIYIKLLMICLQKTFKAVSSDSPQSSGIRSFALLIELYKFFTKHPPETLKSGLPSLTVYDFVFKILREITNTLIEKDVEKTMAFINWTEQDKLTTSSTFIIYIKNILAKALKAKQEKSQD